MATYNKKILFLSALLTTSLIFTPAIAKEYNRSKTVTTGSGKTLTKSVKGAYDKDSKTLNREVTGVKGQTRSTSSSYDPENKTINSTGSNGATRTTSANDGTVTSTTTGPNGKSVTKTRTYNP